MSTCQTTQQPTQNAPVRALRWRGAALFAASLAILCSLGIGRAQADGVSFVVDRSERTVTVYFPDNVFRMYDVAVGKPGHETPLGRWEFFQVDINPDWTPPDSDWAAGASYTPPGDPANPMGRARLMFDPPYTIHGTEVLDSLGRAASHGSIRVANEIAIQLAELLLREGEAWQGEEWFHAMLADPTEMHRIPLHRRIPIEVVD